MKANHLRVAALFWSSLVSCQLTAPISPHSNLDADSEPLRAAFNADVGKVRVLMLVSPT
jgi:hypothetical protein